MPEINVFMVGHAASGSDEIKLAEPLRVNNMAVSFTESLAEFFYDFAEKHFICEQGDQILLLRTSIDSEEIDESDFISCFKAHSERLIASSDGEIIRRRLADDPASEMVNLKVRNNLYENHRLLLDKSKLLVS